ncbi:hypothetical protein KC19_VG151600 [Ceratodon purpureus]|uniref:Uncharacterized protein n=1 Tax=Ceratodon purpureus TaxID=3225 RepID=A0A8T0HRE6_CERPU|nr:hypothetical protein KC19_VG151600 [Ceratodon purpureus]
MRCRIESLVSSGGMVCVSPLSDSSLVLNESLSLKSSTGMGPVRLGFPVKAGVTRGERSPIVAGRNRSRREGGSYRPMMRVMLQGFSLVLLSLRRRRHYTRAMDDDWRYSRRRKGRDWTSRLIRLR